MKLRLDISGLERAFEKMQDDASRHGKDMATEQAGFFLRKLKSESRKITPSVEKLVNVATSLGWRLKRKTGVTPAKELKRRIRSRFTFARQWKITSVTERKFGIRIHYANFAAESLKVDNRTQISENVSSSTKSRFKAKLDKLADRITRI